MNTLKAYLSDKITLLMSLVGLLMVIFNIILILLQINSSKTVAIVRYNSIAATEFTRGDMSSLYLFIVAPIVFFASSSLLAVKIHEKNKPMSLIVVGLNYIVLLFCIIVSSAILNINK